MNSNSTLIDGIHIPLTIPFTSGGDVYLRKLEANVSRYSLGPAAALVALSRGTEAETLADAEIADILRAISSAAAAEKLLIAAISKASVRGALAIVEMAHTAGFDAVLLSPPTRGAQLSENELLLFFRAVADGSPLPVLLFSSAGEQQLSVDQIAKLAHHPNIVGLYDADLNVGRYRAIAEATQAVKHDVTVTQVFTPVTRRMQVANDSSTHSVVLPSGFVSADSITSSVTAPELAPAKMQKTVGPKTRSKSVGFQIMAAGCAVDLVELLEAGVAGAMLTLSACAPQACHEVYAAFKDGDAALSAEKGQRLKEADGALARTGVAGVKHGCDLNGYYGGAPRLPRLPLDGTARTAVERALSGLRN